MSYEDVLAMVKRNGLSLEHLKDQTHAICLAAVQQNGWALEFVKDQTPEICLAAVRQNSEALWYVEEQNEEICLAAVHKDRWALNCVKDLHSIADKIDESIITKGLNYSDNEFALVYQKLVKIRKANAIAKRVNDHFSQVNIKQNRLKL